MVLNAGIEKQRGQDLLLKNLTQNFQIFQHFQYRSAVLGLVDVVDAYSVNFWRLSSMAVMCSAKKNLQFVQKMTYIAQTGKTLCYPRKTKTVEMKMTKGSFVDQFQDQSMHQGNSVSLDFQHHARVTQ